MPPLRSQSPLRHWLLAPLMAEPYIKSLRW